MPRISRGHLSWAAARRSSRVRGRLRGAGSEEPPGEEDAELQNQKVVMVVVLQTRREERNENSGGGLVRNPREERAAQHPDLVAADWTTTPFLARAHSYLSLNPVFFASHSSLLTPHSSEQRELKVMIVPRPQDSNEGSTRCSTPRDLDTTEPASWQSLLTAVDNQV
ncbi:hypothetical protein KQX54_019275 [Cotesia glomerata]|uniref:Uncharacterized protein n=1 Tax=Cotesia glomerata TaxID=32391 RepID=A0AAV7J0L9_COTGL|nr:hypothetical protein KQX54_019275 [Cotesia glomerata]